MGISVPINRQAFNATDNVLLLDETEYSTTDTDYELLVTYNFIETISVGSGLRLYFDMKQSVEALPSSYVQVRIFDGTSETVITTEDDAHSTYQTKTVDFYNEMRAGYELRFYEKASAGRTAYLKNINICGERSPIV